MQNGGQVQPENLLSDPMDGSDEEEQQYTDDERSPLSEPIYGGRYRISIRLIPFHCHRFDIG